MRLCKVSNIDGLQSIQVSKFNLLSTFNLLILRNGASCKARHMLMLAMHNS